ncbi:MAG: hypothetical protein LLF76_02245 [Planctomycetaceae bacterium]|nr:hypothetical protein [Planctomycetaceae bacterium]
MSGIGNAAGQSSQKTEQAGSKMASGFAAVKKAVLAVVNEVSAIATAFVAAAVFVAKFYDDLKTKNDEAVKQVQELRKSYEDLFDVLGASDEASRQQVVKESTELLADTRVSKETGIPIIASYNRQFKDTMRDDEFEKGIRGMLSFGALHGGQATPAMIDIMAGWGMNTAARQGEFRRMVSAVPGLEEDDVIAALGRGMPTIRAMGWTPEQAIANVGILSRGEAGRMRSAMPATTFEAIAGAQTEKAIKDYGIKKELAEDPLALYNELDRRVDSMSQKDAYKTLQEVYGGGAKGVWKLMTSDRSAVQNALERARGPEGVRDEDKEFKDYLYTLEAITAGSEAAKDKAKQDVTAEETFRAEVRSQGEEYRKVLERRQPVRQGLYQFFTPKGVEQEHAAYQQWLGNLSDEERQAVRDTQRQAWSEGYSDPFVAAWQRKGPQGQYEALMGIARGNGQGGGNITINNTYNNNTFIVDKPPAASVRSNGGY